MLRSNKRTRSLKNRTAPRSDGISDDSGEPRGIHSQLEVSSDDDKGNSKSREMDMDSESEQSGLETESDKENDKDDDNEDDDFDDSEDDDLDDHEDDDLDDHEDDNEEDDESEQLRKKVKLDAKEAREKQKATKLARRMQKPNYDIVEKAKRLCEVARRKRLSNTERDNVLEQLTELVKGHCRELAFRHDASRVLQIIIKKGKAEERDMIASELAGNYVELSKSPYSKFLVQRTLLYCPSRRGSIIEEFYGLVRKLIRHKESSEVIEYMFGVAKLPQRLSLMSEFYGPKFALFKDHNKDTLEQILKESPEQREIILQNLSQAIRDTLNKGTVRHSIVHRALLDYFSNAPEKDIREMIAVMHENIAEFLHTREGSRVAMLCFSHGTAKDRKQIVKQMKLYIQKICCEEHGHLVVLRALDIVDDTTMMAKDMLKEIMKNVKTIAMDKYGHRVFLFLLRGRSPIYFHRTTIDLLAADDPIHEKTSKKDPNKRAEELLNAISGNLVEYATENMQEIVRNTFATLVMCETMLCAIKVDKAPALKKLASLAQGEPGNDRDTHVMTSFVNRTLKILVNGRHRLPEHFPPQPTVDLHFGSMLLPHIRDHILAYATDKAASFVVLALLESPETRNEVRGLLVPLVEKIKGCAEECGVQLILKELNVKMDATEHSAGTKRPRKGKAGGSAERLGMVC